MPFVLVGRGGASQQNLAQLGKTPAFLRGDLKQRLFQFCGDSDSNRLIFCHDRLRILRQSVSLHKSLA
jgi:hypothetical protein